MRQGRAESRAPDHRIDGRLPTVTPDHAIFCEASERGDGVKLASRPSLLDWWHHDDVAEAALRHIDRTAFLCGPPTGCRTLEQDASVNVIRKK